MACLLDEAVSLRRLKHVLKAGNAEVRTWDRTSVLLAAV